MSLTSSKDAYSSQRSLHQWQRRKYVDHAKKRSIKKRKDGKRPPKYVGAAQFEGPSLERCKESFRLQLRDSLSRIGLSDLSGRALSRAFHAGEVYLNKCYSLIAKLPDSQATQVWAEGAKKSIEKLEEFINDFVARSYDSEYELTLVMSPDKGKTVYDIEKVYYIPRDSVYFLIDLESEEVISFTQCKLDPCYTMLLQACVNLVAFLFSKEEEGLVYLDPQKIKQCLNSIISLGYIFQLTNPDDKMLDEFADKTILSRESGPRYNEPPEEFMSLWNSFLSDLWEGRKPYVQEASRALKLTEQYRRSVFTFEDYYFSSKASATRDDRFKGIKQASLVSIFEMAHHIDEPVIQDVYNLIGYRNGYNKLNPDIKQTSNKISLEIRNPSKFKPRIIELASNEIADICNYIMHRYRAFLNLLPSSCTEEQDRGLEFGLKVTNPIWVSKRHNNVYCWDWEDCTANVSWWFDDLCFGIVFPELLPFWKWVRGMSVTHKYATSGKGDREYHPTGKGQPAGLPGSFDDMDWFHNVIDMLTLKLSHHENWKLSDFLRDLGDDDGQSTIGDDPPNPNLEGYQDKAGYRTPVQLAFRKICDWVNLPINDSKCRFNEYVEGNSNHYVFEFAHKTIVNGRHDSPLPPSLSLQYDNPNYQIQALAWQLDFGWTDKMFIDTIFDRSLTKRESFLFKCLFHSGIIPTKYFKKFEDHTYEFDPRIKAVVKAAYYYSALKEGGIFSCISDKFELSERSRKKTLDTFQKMALSKRLQKAVLDIENTADHKFCQLIQHNEEIEDLIIDMYDIPVDGGPLVSAMVVTKPEIREGFRQLKRLLEMIPSRDGYLTEDYFLPQGVLNLDCDAILRASQNMVYKFSRHKRDLDSLVTSATIKEADYILKTFLPSTNDYLNGECGALTESDNQISSI